MDFEFFSKLGSYFLLAVRDRGVVRDLNPKVVNLKIDLFHCTPSLKSSSLSERMSGSMEPQMNVSMEPPEPQPT